MTDTSKLYTTKEIEKLFEGMKIPDDPETGNEIEATLELTVKATFLLYQHADQETGKKQRSFAVRFYHDDCNESEPVFPSTDYAAEIQDVNGNDMSREIDFDEIAGILQIDPDKALWDLEIEPD